jgi:hypothetical protein
VTYGACDVCSRLGPVTALVVAEEIVEECMACYLRIRAVRGEPASTPAPVGHVCQDGRVVSYRQEVCSRCTALEV